MGDGTFYPHEKEANIRSVVNIATGNNVFDSWKIINYKEIIILNQDMRNKNGG